MPEVEVA